MGDRAKVIAVIARGLSEAQRRSVIRARVDWGRGYWPLSNALSAKGLINSMDGLTPLGRQVREYILAQQEKPHVG